MMKSRTSQRIQKGFSLIEVIVSASIGTVVILMMTFALRLGADGFNEATHRIDALVEARAAMGTLADDVSTIVGARNQDFGWRNTDERFHEVFFLTLKPIESQDPDEAVGDVCFVHYFTAVTQDAPVPEAAFSRKLYRRFLSSGELIGSLNSGQLPQADANPDQAEIVAFNVTRFVAQPLASGGNFNPLIEWTPSRGLPESLRVDFQVVDDDVARLLREEADWNLGTPLAQNLILENNEDDESNRGRSFELDLEIGHEN